MKLIAKTLSYLEELLKDKEEHALKNHFVFTVIPYDFKDSQSGNSVNCTIKDDTGIVKLTMSKKAMDRIEKVKKKEGEKIHIHNLWKCAKIGENQNIWINSGNWFQLTDNPELTDEPKVDIPEKVDVPHIPEKVHIADKALLEKRCNSCIHYQVCKFLKLIEDAGEEIWRFFEDKGFKRIAILCTKYKEGK